MTSIAIQVTLNPNVSMKRLDEVAAELSRAGMTVAHTIKSLSMIVGSVEDQHLIPEFRRIPDIKTIIVKEA